MQPMRKSNLKHSFSVFTDGTTLHGIKYVFNEKYRLVRKIIWCLFILGMAATLITLLVESLIKYYQYESTTNTMHKLAMQMEMPSITICPNYIFNNRSIYKYYPDMADDISLYIIPMIAETSSINISGLPTNVQEFMRNETFNGFYTNTKPDRTYLHCRINVTYFYCEPFLTDVVTDKGVCRTFHSQTFINNNGPIVAHAPGPDNGISIAMDTEPDDEILPLSHGAGFRVFIHDPKVYPLMEQRSFGVAPGTEVLVSMTKSVSKYLKKPYSERDCVTNDEEDDYKHYSISPDYSYESCYTNCYYNDILFHNCNCSFLPSSNIQQCTLDKLECTAQNIAKNPPSAILQACNYCLSKCEETSYNVQITSLAYPNKLAVDIAKTYNFPIQDKAEMASRYLELKVYFGNMRYTITEQNPTADLGQLFSNFGGLMGLFLGASIVTLFEFIDFFFTYFLKNVWHADFGGIKTTTVEPSGKEKKFNANSRKDIHHGESLYDPEYYRYSYSDRDQHISSNVSKG